MAFYESINFILDPVLSPFISLGHFWAVFLIFGWMLTNHAYEPIAPGERFDVYVFFDGEKADEASIIVTEGMALLSNKTAAVRKIDAGEKLQFKNTYLTKKRYSGFLEE